MEFHFLKELLAGSLLSLGLAACTSQEVIQGNLNVIPLPQEVTQTNEQDPFVINSATTICYPKGNEKMERTAHFLASYIHEVAGTTVKVSTEAGNHSINLLLDKSINEKEGYQLDVTTDQITIKGATEVGVFYGIQTLHKALPVTDGSKLAAIPVGDRKSVV